MSYKSVCHKFPHIPLLRCTVVRLNEVQSIRPQLDLWEKPERMRGFLALLYLHSKFKNRLKDVQLFLRQNCLRNTPFLLLFFFLMSRNLFLSYVAVTLLSVQVNSSHCMLTAHSLAGVQQTQARYQHGVVDWSRDWQLGQTTFATVGRWHKNTRHQRRDLE